MFHTVFDHHGREDVAMEMYELGQDQDQQEDGEMDVTGEMAQLVIDEMVDTFAVEGYVG